MTGKTGPLLSIQCVGIVGIARRGYYINDGLATHKHDVSAGEMSKISNIDKRKLSMEEDTGQQEKGRG